MEQIRKYGTDEYGNVWNDFAQIEPIRETVCYNPEKETLIPPPEISENENLKIEKGEWKIIEINSNLIKENGYIRPKTPLELMRDGLEIIPKGFKIIDNKKDLYLEEKTLEEQLQTNEITQLEYNKIKLEECYYLRGQAYLKESDGLFFKYQRGEIKKKIWLDKVKEIKLKYPKP